MLGTICNSGSIKVPASRRPLGKKDTDGREHLYSNKQQVKQTQQQQAVAHTSSWGGSHIHTESFNWFLFGSHHGNRDERRDTFGVGGDAHYVWIQDYHGHGAEPQGQHRLNANVLLHHAPFIYRSCTRLIRRTGNIHTDWNDPNTGVELEQG